MRKDNAEDGSDGNAEVDELRDSGTEREGVKNDSTSVGVDVTPPKKGTCSSSLTYELLPHCHSCIAGEVGPKCGRTQKEGQGTL